jgi:hypothetical protein
MYRSLVTLQVIFHSLCKSFVLSVASTFIFNWKTASENRTGLQVITGEIAAGKLKTTTRLKA